MLGSELPQREHSTLHRYGKHVQVLSLLLVPLQIRNQHEPSIGVLISVDDPFDLRLAIKDIEDPLQRNRYNAVDPHISKGDIATNQMSDMQAV